MQVEKKIKIMQARIDELNQRIDQIVLFFEMKKKQFRDFDRRINELEVRGI